MLQNKLCKLDLEMPSIGDSEHLILTMLCKPNVDVWMPLLGACRSHCNVEMGEQVAKQALVGSFCCPRALCVIGHSLVSDTHKISLHSFFIPSFCSWSIGYGGFAIGKLPECIVVSTPDIGSSFTNGGVEFNARVIFITGDGLLLINHGCCEGSIAVGDLSDVQVPDSIEPDLLFIHSI